MVRARGYYSDDHGWRRPLRVRSVHPAVMIIIMMIVKMFTEEASITRECFSLGSSSKAIPVVSLGVKCGEESNWPPYLATLSHSAITLDGTSLLR